ncbi:hypothetical protein FBU30_004551 [Linnemannia zychae]|nr:hypothetical protein FBU30_004551 [Linnemannia zychae]
MPHSPVQLTDLSDQILLRIFSFIATTAEHDPNPNDSNTHQTPSSELAPEPVTTYKPAKKKSKPKNTKNRVAGLGARTLCRLCCCSKRLNHLASADQLWQELTLARFPDRHWPTTDQKNLDMIRVRREHQLKLLAPSSAESTTQDSQVPNDQVIDSSLDQLQDQENDNREDGQNKKQKRTKFYSRFEQRAHRRQFASLDPELKYTPLAWTNTFWTWKRTFFGNCRFVESKDVSTPNRIAVDIQTLMSDNASESTPSTRYFCQGCTHSHDTLLPETTKGALDQDLDKAKETPSSYPYKLIIALDGSWSHAKIMYRCNPRLQQLTQIKFPNPPQSIYHELKPEPKTTYTSTAEAVSQAVSLLGWPSDSLNMSTASTYGQLLLEDIIRPLKKMIEIQDTIQDQQKDQ